MIEVGSHVEVTRGIPFIKKEYGAGVYDVESVNYSVESILD